MRSSSSSGSSLDAWHLGLGLLAQEGEVRGVRELAAYLEELGVDGGDDWRQKDSRIARAPLVGVSVRRVCCSAHLRRFVADDCREWDSSEVLMGSDVHSSSCTSVSNCERLFPVRPQSFGSRFRFPPVLTGCKFGSNEDATSAALLFPS